MERSPRPPRRRPARLRRRRWGRSKPTGPAGHRAKPGPHPARPAPAPAPQPASNPSPANRSGPAPTPPCPTSPRPTPTQIHHVSPRFNFYSPHFFSPPDFIFPAENKIPALTFFDLRLKTLLNIPKHTETAPIVPHRHPGPPTTQAPVPQWYTRRPQTAHSEQSYKKHPRPTKQTPKNGTLATVCDTLRHFADLRFTPIFLQWRRFATLCDTSSISPAQNKHSPQFTCHFVYRPKKHP